MNSKVNLIKEIDQVLGIISKLSETELKLVAQAVRERMKLFIRQRNLQELSKFTIGEKVKFKHQGKVYKGVVIRINQKSVSVHTDAAGHWNIGPNFLRKIK